MRLPGAQPEFTASERELFERVRRFTMTGQESVAQLARSVEYVVGNDLRGSIVECGVWRGGSMMCIAYTLLRLGVTDRDLYLFDTYDGMTQPDALDAAHNGTAASAILATSEKTPDNLFWAYATLDEVRTNLALTGYPMERIHFVKGRVEDTLPAHAPREIALLRLDTDWYASTHHELVHLYPRLALNGVLIIDDYGFWRGARQAVDEYFSHLPLAPLLHRIDGTAHSCVKAVQVPALPHLIEGKAGVAGS